MKKNLVSGVVLALIAGTAVVTACNGGGSSTPTPSPTATVNSLPSNSPVNVTTYHNDNMRDGQNNNETVLTPSKVSGSDFGKIGALPVDGLIYGQPLYVKNVTIAGSSGTHDVVYVATEHDTVFAFDADTLSSTPLWKRNFTGDSVLACTSCTTLSYLDTLAPNIYPEVGITATPVIDMSTGIMYVTAVTKESGTIVMKLHALNIDSGAEMPGSPVVIAPTLAGTGAGNVNGMITFDPTHQLSRAALTLANGNLLIGFSSWDDREPAHGWVVSYNPKTLALQGSWMSTPHSGDGNIWMSGGGLVVDQTGGVYFATGNGDPTDFSFDDFSDSVLKLTVSSTGALALGDYFTPYNTVALAEGDVDLGSGAVMALPDQPGTYPHLLVAGGKQGTVYLMNRDLLGGNILLSDLSATGDTNIVQELQNFFPGGKSFGPGNYSTPAYFNETVFYCPAGSPLTAFPMSNGLLSTSVTRASNIIAHEGSTPSISSNGTSDGIVWIADASAYTYSWTSPNINVLTNGPAVIYAYDAANISTPIYSSSALAADSAGYATKFSVPTVADGKVFLGTQTEVSVYGLKSETVAKNAAKTGRTPASITASLAPAKVPAYTWEAPRPKFGSGENSCGMSADTHAASWLDVKKPL